MKLAFEGHRRGFSFGIGRLDFLYTPQPSWPREWSFCREPGSMEFQAGRRVLTVAWGRYEPEQERRWSVPFPWPWASPVAEAGK